MLVEQYRYDMSWQQDSPGGTETSNYGASRGLEIIPTTRFEVGVFPPGYFAHQSQTSDGFGDLSWQMKFRAFSATEGKGDYFVGFFLGGSFPTGTPPNGLGRTVLSPTFAAAKGLGPWDVQSTMGANLPASGTNLLGRAIVFNTAVDYRIKGKIWPMLEQNSIFWSGGSLDGKKEVFLTPVLVVESFPLAEPTPSFRGRRHTDRGHAISSIQPPRNSLGAFSVLSGCSTTESLLSSKFRCPGIVIVFRRRPGITFGSACSGRHRLITCSVTSFGNEQNHRRSSRCADKYRSL
jgi:hypothetical protein